jgi:methylmalonyl-CoA mutase
VQGLEHLSDLPGKGSQVRGSRLSGFLEAGWLVSQELTATSPAELNAMAKDAVDRGQTELNIWPDYPTRSALDADAPEASAVGVCGVPLSTVEDFKTLLAGLDLGKISLYLQSGKAAPALYALLVAALRDNGTELGSVKGCLGMDPLGWLAETGELPGDPDKIHDGLAAIVRHAALSMPHLQVLEVKGHACHNAGASSTQELAAVLAGAVTYLKALSERGIDPAEVVSRMRLSVSIGGNYFLEIAKLRALRLLWSRVMDAFEVPDDKRAIHIHARTGLWNKTVFDPYVNMLRTTTEAFSAVVGGCDSLHVGHFDEIMRESDTFSRRIARNTHAILAEECDMRRVIDPAGGSWAVESLTDQMAAEAWKKFQEIEADGGILAVLKSGKLQEAVESVRQEKIKNIQRRKDVIVGTNSYPNAAEELLKPHAIDYKAAAAESCSALAEWKSARDADAVKTGLAAALEAEGAAAVDALVKAAAAGATLSELQLAAGWGTASGTSKPLTLQRAAGEFEQLRIAAAGLAQGGQPPLVHQLNMGPSRRYRIRADWTSAFFQVGGFTVLNDVDFEGVDDAVKALAKSGAKAAIITSDDETYASTVTIMAKAIKEANAGVKVLVAGAPGDNEEEWRAAGVDDFVNIRVNNYQFNRSLLESMGAAL